MMSKNKGGLGRGLSALIRPAEPPMRTTPASGDAPASASEIGSINEIELRKIRPNPFQPRADFDQQALDELKESIRQNGIIQPVTVRPSSDGTYELISGERRVRASNEIGLKSVPAYIIEVKSDAEMLELALIENLQREHLNPVEIALSYQRLTQEVGLSAEDIAARVGKDRTTIVNFIRLLKLPQKIQDALRRGKISAGHARMLVALPDELVQMRFFEKIVKKDLNVRQVEKLIRDYNDASGAKKAKPRRQIAAVEDNMAERVQQVLATRVRINTQNDGRGEIVIEFYSNDDLGRLFDLLLSIQP
jgi:ParB family transcriptional regulator, chromosome partitioning protein